MSNNSIPGIPAGSVIDLRTYGMGFTSWDGKSGTAGMDKLIADIHEAQFGFTPYMELVDKIRHPAREFPEPAEGKLIAGVA